MYSLLGEAAVLAHVEAYVRGDRHTRRLLEGDGVDEQLDALSVVLPCGIAREFDPPGVEPTLEASCAALPPAELVPAFEHRIRDPLHLATAEGCGPGWKGMLPFVRRLEILLAIPAGSWRLR
jgi:hypothetical protein